tara:strand:+ start:193 stop:351 length:159 start_codon:yes stop_codon:yes gene_type:complete
MNVTKDTAKNFIPKKLFGMRKKSIKQKLASLPKVKLGDYNERKSKKNIGRRN